MKISNIYARNLFIKSDEDIYNFIKIIGKLLNADFKEHESSNYYKNIYFKANILCCEIKIMYNDDFDDSIYKYCIHVNQNGIQVSDTVILDIVDWLAKYLTSNNFGVLRSIEWDDTNKIIFANTYEMNEREYKINEIQIKK